MKTLGARSVVFGAAILLLGASARQASAGEIHSWGYGGYEYGDGGSCGYGGCGPGGYGFGAGCGCCGWPPTDYARYIVGHGPMFPGRFDPRLFLHEPARVQYPGRAEHFTRTQYVARAEYIGCTSHP